MKIYTDGSCTNNGKKNARAGCGAYFGKDDKRNVSSCLDDLQIHYNLKGINSNNRAELMAILVGIDKGNPSDIIVTDSKYSIQCLTVWLDGWKKNNMMTSTNKPVLNQDLILLIEEKMIHKNITLKHVMAHTGFTDEDSIGNSEADKLAGLASAS